MQRQTARAVHKLVEALDKFIDALWLEAQTADTELMMRILAAFPDSLTRPVHAEYMLRGRQRFEFRADRREHAKDRPKKRRRK